MIQYLGLVWLGVLFLSAWALIGVASTSLTWRNKLIWAVAILVLPLFGALAWFLVGRVRAAS